ERTLKNICCVGDDDQSIYGWRGADVDNILRFEHDFPGARIIRLERNYRSTGHILAAASHLIAHNQGRLGKTLRTEDEPGEKVKVTSCWDSEEEARAIGEEIEQLQRNDGRGDATVQLLHDHARRRRVPLTAAAQAVIETDELKPKPRTALRDLLAAFERWRTQKETLPHMRLAETMLDESGYTEMWQKDRS